MSASSIRTLAKSFATLHVLAVGFHFRFFGVGQLYIPLGSWNYLLDGDLTSAGQMAFVLHRALIRRFKAGVWVGKKHAFGRFIYQPTRWR
jgi:hypothetical protein